MGKSDKIITLDEIKLVHLTENQTEVIPLLILGLEQPVNLTDMFWLSPRYQYTL